MNFKRRTLSLGCFAAKHQLTDVHLIYIYEYQHIIIYSCYNLREVHVNQLLIVTWGAFRPILSTQGFCLLSNNNLMATCSFFPSFKSLFSLRCTVIHTLLSTIRRNLEYCVFRAHAVLLSSVSQMRALFSSHCVLGEALTLTLVRKRHRLHHLKHRQSIITAFQTTSSTQWNPLIHTTSVLHLFSIVSPQCIELPLLYSGWI